MKRRHFLGSAPCAALSSLSITNTLLNLKLINNAAAAPLGLPGDYKALVCLFFNGGNDSFNMLVPTEASEYANYSAIRSNLALPLPATLPGGDHDPATLRPINVTNTPGRTFGIHPALANLQTRFNEGNAAFFANIGTLIEPTTIAQFDAKSVSLPKSIGSHNTQLEQWQTSIPHGRSKTGWGGRLADKVMSQNPSNAVSMNISLDGNQTFLVGDDNFSFTIGQNGAALLTGSGAGDSFSQARVQTARSMVEQTQRNILKRAFAEEKIRSYDSAEAFTTAYDSVSLATPFSSGGLAQDLESVARSIGARDQIGHCRQIFFVQLKGFDNHDELLGNHGDLMASVDAALSDFWNAMVELGLEDQVTVFSGSDFGRTIRSNGAGTDHAWGGNALVMGGAVRKRLEEDLPPMTSPTGSKIFGNFPDPSELTLGAGLDTGFNGRYLPTTAVDEYFSELALWFGLPPGELAEVFPNLSNFYSYSPSTAPLGFLL